VAGVVAFAWACTPSGPSKSASPSVTGPSTPKGPTERVSAPPALTRGIPRDDRRDGLFLLTPGGWSFLQHPSGPVEPGTVFAVATYRIPRGGACAPTRALQALPDRGAVAWVIEYSGAARSEEFPARPKRFFLDPSALSTYECSGSHATYMIRFRDQGRAFQVHVAFGRQSSRELRDRMLAVLSSLKVDRCPPARPPELVSRFGTLRPEHGPPGERVTLSGPTGRDEDWFWYPFSRIEVWWSRHQIGVPQETPAQHLLASIGPGTRCRFEASFRVPATSKNRYLITVLGYYQGGFGTMAERRFVVTGG
jgi:hypothetical protein